jgi:hexosaminidase
MPWPQPTSITHNNANEDTRVILSPEISFVINDEPVATADIPDWFRDALGILFQQMATVQNIPAEEEDDIAALPELTTINFNIAENNDTIPFGDNEKYSIAMDDSLYSVDITAPSAFGALRAMQTLVQLVRQGRGYNYIPNFPITVEDKPKFPHRGLLLDTAREYYHVSTIKNIIRFLGANKMSVLHWHITDDHAFSVECKKYPGLAKGSTFDGPFYTQEDVKEIVQLAARHGVRIIPEIGGPAHAGMLPKSLNTTILNLILGSWINEHHPDMITNCPKFSCQKAWGVTMNPTLDKTYEMLQDFFNEMAALFPDPYMHFGGDEVLL